MEELEFKQLKMLIENLEAQVFIMSTLVMMARLKDQSKNQSEMAAIERTKVLIEKGMKLTREALKDLDPGKDYGPQDLN